MRIIKIKILTIILILCFSKSAFAFEHTHKLLNEVLKTHVVVKQFQSFVNYKKLKKKPETLEKYLRILSAVKQKEFNSFSKDQRLAFLINAYNAFTLKIIIDNYPVKSIIDIGSLFKSTWKKKFFILLEKESHLDNIEHNLIRKNFNEPRIHFAVNCASIGCPSLLNAAFEARKLDTQLEASAKNFLSNEKKNYFKNKKLKISKIFKWYGEDFVKKFGSVEKFIAPYLSKNKREQKNIANKKYPLGWTDYDWKLNDI